MQYIAFIHTNTDSSPSGVEWQTFIAEATECGLFRGGSEIGGRTTVGTQSVPDTTDNVGGFMRFDSDDRAAVVALLQRHPVVRHGGTIELCEMPKSE